MKTYLIVDDDDDVETITISDDEQKRTRPKISYVENLTDAVETETSSDDGWEENDKKCRTCAKYFRTAWHLRRHRKVVTCKIVRKKRKRRRITCDKGGSECEICGKHFSYPFNLRRHRKFVMCAPSAGEKPCCVCGAIYTSQTALNEHLTLHFSYRCFCGRLFDTHKGYSIHRVRHCRLYECYDCGKKYFKKNDLIRHLGEEHRNTEVYICFQCDKVCVLREDIINHIGKCTAKNK